MATEIRGLTVKFDADFTEFRKNMSKADKDISSTQKQLRSLSESLKFEFDPSKFERSQKLLQDAMVATDKKADLLRQRLAEMEKAGVTDKTRNEYNYLQEQLAKTETSAQKLEQQLEDLNKIKVEHLTAGIDKLGQGLENAGKKLAPLSALAGGAIVGLGKLGMNARHVADDIATIANQFDINTTALQKWEYWALQSDVPFDKLQKGFIKTRQALGKQMAGEVDRSTEALDALGIKMSDFASSEDAFEGVIKALGAVEDTTLQAHYATEIFGSRIANDMIPILKTGGETLDSYTAELEKVGYLSEEQVTALADFDNVLNRIETASKQLGIQLGASLLPIMEYFAEIIEAKLVPKFKEWADMFNSLDLEQQKLIVGILAFVTALAPTLLILGKLSSGISSIIKLVAKLGSKLTLTMGIVGAVIAILGIAYAKNEQFRNSVNNLVQVLFKALNPMLRSLGDVLTVIAPILGLIGNIVAQLLIPALNLLTPIIEGVGNALGWLYDTFLKPILDIVMKIVDGIEYVLSGGKKKPSSGSSFGGSSSYAPIPSGSTNIPKMPEISYPEFNMPSMPSATGSVPNTNNYVEDNSKYEINVTITPTGELDYDAKELADKVIKEIVIQKQAMGR